MYINNRLCQRHCLSYRMAISFIFILAPIYSNIPIENIQTGPTKHRKERQRTLNWSTKHRKEQQRTWNHTMTKNDKGL